ncbi:hypothetical protein FKG94_20420 [Exilibacterium tricleocarpae]|uniref:Uncharacterized protein n=1 Tax=Exilibacterium tricleocarpae TaxID=2591008 RepID=A0A545T0J3_9GAMM|nr:hypothetical protein [Exilibacterium tricleocarpae]TQV70699.1 hypothetical protein FKG94_20420 [Exilibacterium tricleocarpae]
MKVSKFFCLTLTLLCLWACSNRQVYESLQAGQRRECQLLPESQIQDCLARHQQTYDEYLREKQEVENTD